MSLILASGSQSRAALLHAAGVAFKAIPADLDEAALMAGMTGASVVDVALALAQAKAVAVSGAHPGALVLGGDSVIGFGGRHVSKCADMGDARALLARLRGREHLLVSAAALARDGEIVWSHVSPCRMVMRDFSDAFLDEYLAAAGPAILSSVGCYHYEGLGAQLFQSVEGDYFSVLGLPLLPVLAALRQEGELKNMTAKAAVVGWPIQHSLSPVLHGHWLKQYGIDGTYEKIAVEPGTFAQRIAELRAAGYRGVNVTVPYKEEAFALATKPDLAASVAGAANLLFFKPDMIGARNTDAVGLFDSLEEGLDRGSLAGQTIILMGAGGAARGAAFGLNHLGHAGKTIILNRTKDRADQIAAQITKTLPTADFQTGTLTDWPSVAGQAALLINTTSAGMKGNPPLDIDLSALNPKAVVCDIVYNPLMTPLLKDAEARGHRIIDGLGMLMHQAAPSFQAFFHEEMGGEMPKVTPALRAELIEALNARA